MTTSDFLDDAVRRWEVDESNLNKLGETVKVSLQKEIWTIEKLPDVKFRVKDFPGVIRKIIIDKKNYDEITDKLGIRIIANFLSELDEFETIVEKIFLIHKAERKHENLKYNELAYTSNHYDVSINPDYFTDIPLLKDYIFEIQIRTRCQDVWADLNHGLTYKTEKQTESIKRRIFRLTSLFEIADQEFDQVNDFLLSLPENIPAMLLKVLEGKYYKYARRPYNKELSLDNIDKLLTLIPENEIQNVNVGIKSFVDSNEVQIDSIYNSGFLTSYNLLSLQPEAILVYYLLEKYPMLIRRKWPEQFPEEDLVDLSIAIGKPIN